MDLRGEEDETQHLKKISIIRLSQNYLSFPPKKDATGSVWRGLSGPGDGAIGSGGLGGLFEDYEDVYIQSWRPGARSSGLWKSDGQVKFTNYGKWKTFVGWKINLKDTNYMFSSPIKPHMVQPYDLTDNVTII